MFVRVTVLLFIIVAMAGCRAPLAPAGPTPTPAPPAGSCSLELTDGVSDEDAIRAVLAAEGELVVAQDIEPLMQLWAEEGVVADAGNTPERTDDDQRWIAKDAIRHRYVRTVFPGAPSAVQPADLQIVIDGDAATVRATTHIGDEVAPAGDRWELEKRDGCWVIKSLTYNLEPAQ